MLTTGWTGTEVEEMPLEWAFGLGWVGAGMGEPRERRVEAGCSVWANVSSSGPLSASSSSVGCPLSL